MDRNHTSSRNGLTEANLGDKTQARNSTIKYIFYIKYVKEYELRVIIWECSGVPSNDIEDTSDLYVTGRMG